MDRNSKTNKASNLALVQTQNETAVSTEPRPGQDHYNQAVQFANELLKEEHLDALMKRVFAAARTLLPICGLRFQDYVSNSVINLGEQATHSMSFDLSDQNKTYGELTFYHRNRLKPYEESVELLENLLALVLPALKNCQQKLISRREISREKLLDRLSMSLQKGNADESLVLIKLDAEQHSTPLKTETLLKDIIQLVSRTCCFFSATLDTDSAAVMLPASKAEFIAERIRLIIAANAQSGEEVDTTFNNAAKISISEISKAKDAEQFLNRAIYRLAKQSAQVINAV